MIVLLLTKAKIKNTTHSTMVPFESIEFLKRQNADMIGPLFSNINGYFAVYLVDCQSRISSKKSTNKDVINLGMYLGRTLEKPHWI